MSRCDKRVTHDSWHFHPCGKPAKYRANYGDSQWHPLCGIHARAAKNRGHEVQPFKPGGST